MITSTNPVFRRLVSAPKQGALQRLQPMKWHYFGSPVGKFLNKSKMCSDDPNDIVAQLLICVLKRIAKQCVRHSSQTQKLNYAGLVKDKCHEKGRASKVEERRVKICACPLRKGEQIPFILCLRIACWGQNIWTLLSRLRQKPFDWEHKQMQIPKWHLLALIQRLGLVPLFQRLGWWDN